MTGDFADLSRAAWRKSSYSGGNSGDCIEAATVWRKSSYSGSNGGQCVEAAALWRKSSRSGSNGGDCVEVAPVPSHLIAVRDSKDPNGPSLVFAPTQWRAFTADIKTAQ
jgi:Domain of unknown function (DUF397)